MSKKRRVFSAEFKAAVALEAIKEQETINQIASRYDVLPAQVSQWKTQMEKSLPAAFKGGGKDKDPEADWEAQKRQFYQKIGQLEMGRDWLKKNLNSLVSSPEAKRAMTDKGSKLPVTRQCELADLPRSSAYYKPLGISAATLELMRLIDKIYTEFPYCGSRQIKRLLRSLYAVEAGRRRVRRLMRLMGLKALCPKPNLSKPAPGHKIYPYLMKGLTINRPNQAWCADITYIRLDGGFVYWLRSWTDTVVRSLLGSCPTAWTQVSA